MCCCCWRPDGLVFAVGYNDGCIAIWAIEDADKPLSVRTLTTEDVNITDAEEVSRRDLSMDVPYTDTDSASRSFSTLVLWTKILPHHVLHLWHENLSSSSLGRDSPIGLHWKPYSRLHLPMAQSHPRRKRCRMRSEERLYVSVTA